MTEMTPLIASALTFAFEKATTEGKMTIGVLTVLSLFSWTVIIAKMRQIFLARRAGRKFYAAFRENRDPLAVFRQGTKYKGAPVFEVYHTATEELDFQMKNHPIKIKGKTKISQNSFDTVRVALERMVSAQGMNLEKGMVILSTAVSGGPFIGLLGTVWGVMDTFSGVAKANAATLTAMAPGVAGALIATVIGLLVAIPAMFAYNLMVTTIRQITQELDDFAAELGTQIEHQYVDDRPLAEEISAAFQQSGLQASGMVLESENAVA
jgi:biopolymer transport protein TolQ